jgi:hypothetical protein
VGRFLDRVIPRGSEHFCGTWADGEFPGNYTGDGCIAGGNDDGSEATGGGHANFWGRGGFVLSFVFFAGIRHTPFGPAGVAALDKWGVAKFMGGNPGGRVYSRPAEEFQIGLASVFELAGVAAGIVDGDFGIFLDGGLYRGQASSGEQRDGFVFGRIDGMRGGFVYGHRDFVDAICVGAALKNETENRGVSEMFY